jgi:hypothetical protein
MKIINVVFSILILFSISISANSQCYQAGELKHGVWLQTSSGNPNIDAIVYDEIKRLENFFKGRVDFFFGQEASIGNSTAFFSPSCERNPYCIGTIVLGLNMMHQKYSQYGDNYIHIVRSILAHEFGHGVQKLKGWYISSKYKELHADFLAGYYISKSYYYDDKMIDNFLNEFYSIGGYSIHHSHGTKDERYCAFLEGYYYAKESNVSVETADAYAVQYVAANNPCGVRKYLANVARLETDIANNNIGTIIFKSDGKTKYVFVTTDHVGRPIIFYCNRKFIATQYGLQKSPKINEFKLENMSATNAQKVEVYYKGRLIASQNLMIRKGRTTTFQIQKKGLFGHTWSLSVL